jgi:hypothetical protein
MSSSTVRSTSLDSPTRLLLLCGALAGPLFSIAWFIEGLNRDSYDPMRHPISALSLGEFGWSQIVNFIVTGILTLVLAFGLRAAFQKGRGKTWIPRLITIVGIGFLGTGLFATDPLSGYPLGTPPMRLPPTLIGSLHVLFASFILGLPVACVVMARHFDDQGERNWAIYSKITAVAFMIVYVLAMAGFLQLPGLVNYAGLLQRISVIIGLTWMALLPLHLLNSPPNFEATERK